MSITTMKYELNARVPAATDEPTAPLASPGEILTHRDTRPARYSGVSGGRAPRPQRWAAAGTRPTGSATTDLSPARAARARPRSEIAVRPGTGPDPYFRKFWVSGERLQLDTGGLRG